MKKSNLNSICVVLFGFASLAALFPPLRAIVGEFLPSIACCGISVLIILYNHKISDLKVSLTAGTSTAALLYIAVITCLAGNSILFNRYFDLVLFLAGYPVFKEILLESSYKSRKYLLITIGVCVLIACLRTIYALIDSPYLSRSIKSEGSYTYGLLLSGVGGYELVYAAVLGAIIILPKCFSKKMKILLPYTIIFIVLSTLVILSNYITAWIVLSIGCFLVFIFRLAETHQVNAIAGVMVIVIIAILIAVNRDALINLLALISGDGRVSQVLLDSGGIINNITDEFFYDRAPVMEKSVMAFLQEPWIGQIGKTSVLSDIGVIQQAGQHSFILDTFAYFGLLGGLLINLAVLFEIIELARMYTPAAVVPVGLALYILILFNNATPSLAVMVFIILPLIQEQSKAKVKEC